MTDHTSAVERCQGWTDGGRIGLIACINRAKVVRDGKHYCGIHDPVAAEERRAAAKARADAKDAAAQARRAAHRNCPTCAGTGHVDRAAIKQDSEAGAVAWQLTYEGLDWVTTHSDTAERFRREGYNVTPLYAARPAAALPEVDEAMAEKVLDLYVLECIETHRDDAPKAHRIEAMQNALTAALRPETQG